MHALCSSAVFRFSLYSASLSVIMMTTSVLSLVLLLTYTVCLGVCRNIREDLGNVVSSSGQDVILQCTARSKSGVQYIAVSWYKVEWNPSLQRRGLLRKDLPDGEATPYSGVEREVELLNESYGILLPKVTCNDTGLYQCNLAAPVGEQNRDGSVLVMLTDCPPVDISYSPVDAVDVPFRPTENLLMMDNLVIFAVALLMSALFMSLIGYCCMKNAFREKSKLMTKEILLDAPLKPLEKKDLKLIYTLGPKTSTFKNICV